ncbi:MAG: MBL fold metallo-hydrolase [Pararhodobacter sp.]
MIRELHRDGRDLSRGMHVVITGSGSALCDPERGGASAAVLVDGQVLQFDCGRLVMENLMRTGINPVDVDALFLTHLHFDHIASFGYFILSNWVAGRQAVLPVRGPAGTERMARAMVFEGHYADVEFARNLVATWPGDVPGRPMAEPPFTVQDQTPGLIAETDTYRVTAVEVPHFQKFSLHSLAYRVDSAHGSVVVTGDCHPTAELQQLAQGADIVVNECAKPDADMVTGGKLARSTRLDEAAKEQTHPHTTPTWLGESAQKMQAKHVVATHLAPLRAMPAARAMSQVYYGSSEVPEDVFTLYKTRIAANFTGRIDIAEDGMILSV